MKLHQILFWLLIFLLPSQLGKHFWPEFSFVLGIRVDYLSPTLYLTDLLLAGVLLSWVWERRKAVKINKRKLEHFWLLFLVVGFLVVNCLLAKNTGAAFYKLGKITEVFFLGFYVAKTNPKGFLVLPLVLGMIWGGVVAFFQFANQASVGGILWWLGERTFTAGSAGIALAEIGGRSVLRPYGTFSHPNSLGGYFLISLLLVFSLGQKLPSWLKKSALFWGVGISLLAFSRTVWLAGVFSLFWWRWGIWQKKRNLLLFAVFSFLIGTAFFLSFFPGVGSQAVGERIQLIKVGFLMLKEFPLAGVGLNNFVVYLPVFWQEGGVYFLQPVHNIFLLVAVEAGLVGLLLFSWILFLTLIRGAAGGKRELLSVLGVILFLGLFDHYWLTLQQNQLLLGLVFGLLWSKS